MLNHFNGLGFRLDNEARHTVLNNLWYGAAAKCDHGRSTGHCLDHDETKGLGPIDGKEQRRRSSKKLLLLLIVYLADELNMFPIDKRLEAFLEKPSYGPAINISGVSSSPSCQTKPVAVNR